LSPMIATRTSSSLTSKLFHRSRRRLLGQSRAAALPYPATLSHSVRSPCADRKGALFPATLSHSVRSPDADRKAAPLTSRQHPTRKSVHSGCFRPPRWTRASLRRGPLAAVGP